MRPTVAHRRRTLRGRRTHLRLQTVPSPTPPHAPEDDNFAEFVVLQCRERSSGVVRPRIILPFIILPSCVVLVLFCGIVRFRDPAAIFIPAVKRETIARLR